MKNNLKFLSIVLVMLLGLSQGAWADTYYYAKAKAVVSSKSNGMGTVYVGPAVQFASADEATSFDGTQSAASYDVPFEWDEEGLPSPTTGSMADLMPWFAPAGTEAVIYRRLDLTNAGMAQPVYAGYMAQAKPGYYFKGWSTINNDVALGNVNPFAYPVMSQAMTTSAEVKEVQVYVPTMVNGKLQQIAQSMGIYVAEGKSNRYMVAEEAWENMWTDEDGVEHPYDWSKKFYRCPKVAGQYKLYDMDPSAGVMHLYIPHFDNVTRHVYVIDDNGEKVEIKDVDGSYLTFPKDADDNTILGATYIIYKNPYYGQSGVGDLRKYKFLPHRYNLTALASCTNDACFQQTMLTPDFTSPASTLLLVNFQAVMMEYNGKMVPATAVNESGNAIAFLPSMEELPSVPTMYATFAPVQINGCTGGNIVNWSDVTDNTFNVTFSTSYASSTADFGAVTFDKQPDGGAYSAVVTGYNDNEVTIAVTFTPSAGSLADGEYKASMTLPSLGGESYVSCLVNVRVGEEANKALSVTINGEETKYAATEADLTAAFTAATTNSGSIVKLLSDLTLAGVTTAGNYTLDLDGWTLNLPDGNTSVAGTLLLKNGTVNGNVSIASTGNITVDGATINGTLTNNGTANLKRGTFNGGTAVSINNFGLLTLEKGAEVIAQYNAGVVMNAGSNGIVNGAKFYGPYPIDLKAGSDGVFNSAYFTQEFADEMTAMGMTHYDVTVGPAFEAGYTHLYAKDLAAAQAAGTPVCKIGQTGYSSLEDALLYAQNNPTQEVTIIMTNDYTLPAGYYTLPKNASLLIPYQESQTSIMGGSPKKLAISQPYETPSPYRTLTFANGVHMSVAGNIEASCMQFIAGQGWQGNAVPSGAYGWLRLEKGAELTLGNGSHLYAWGFVTGEGEIDVRRGGAVHEDFQVYDWPGGQAAMDMLQNSILTGAGAFPINQYFMQNVESQTTFHPGARMYCSFGASAGGYQVAADAIQIVGIEGDVAMFLMDPNADADNTWVRKRYDVENDIQVWEVNSGAHLGSMLIPVPLLKIYDPSISGFDSRNFILPLTNNLKIHLLSGYMDITQNTELLPGAEIEMDKESTIELLEASDASSGFLYLIDKMDWVDGFACNALAHQIRYSPSWDIPGHDGVPNVRILDDQATMANSKVNVHGTFQVSGFVLATPSADNIISTNEDAGTVVFPNEVNFSTVLDNQPVDVHMPIAAIPNQLIDAMLGEGAGFPIPQWNSRASGKNKTQYMYARSALLHNGIGEPAESAGTTTNEIGFTDVTGNGDYYPDLMIGAWTKQDGDNFTMPGESFCYIRDRWTKMTQYDERFAYNNYNEWYIKPAEYVAVATTAKDVAGEYKDASTSTQPQENPDHTYSDAAGEGRLFIWVESPSDGAPGQWWEVTLEDNLYKGKNGTFYEYREDWGLWVEHTFEITFLNWDGKPVLDHNDKATVYPLHYGDRIQYLGTNPTRAENVDYTYNFTGWSPEITADTKVTGDATYMATFEAIQRKYTIIFLNENGTEIERHFLTRDEIPVCEALPSKTGYYLQWTPAIGAVTRDTAYRATFLPEPPTVFTVTFLNNDGSEIHTYENIAKGTTVNTIFNQAEPEKAGVDGSEYNWTFTGWMPAIDDEMEVEDNLTFIAQYDKAKKTCNVIFKDENGEVLKAATAYEYGQVPVAPKYSKPATDQYTYIVTWPGLQAVTLQQIQAGEDIVYQADVEEVVNKYTVTISATGCVVEGAGVFDYGTEVTLSLGDALEGFENPEWGELPQGYSIVDNKISFTITENVTFTASASIKATATEINLSGSNNTDTYNLSADTKVASLTIEAGGNASAQIIGAEHIEMLAGGRAYYKYNFNAAAGKWYTFGVPFKVNGDQAVGTKTLVREKDYRIVHYNGALRAINGADRSAWEIMGGTLVPGELYMIKFLTNQPTVTFTGTANHNYDYSASASVVEYPASDPLNAGWNGIANPALYIAQLGTGVNEAQVYNPETDGYTTVENISTISVPVGTAAFVQVPASRPIVAAVPSAPVAARRATKEDVDRYVVTLSQSDIQTDKVILRSSEDAEDRYVIGEDLAKAGVSSIVGQMWVNRYGAKLCVNNAAPISGETTYPLSISAPKNGQYTITLTDTMDDMEVVLMENAIPVAILSGAYDLTLAKGTTNDYSIVVRKAPRVTTGMESVADSDAVQKVLVGGKLYILMGGRVYDAMGRLVK